MASWASHSPVEVLPDPKPEKRHRASGAEEKKIRAAFEHACCVTCGMRPVERHHVVPRSQGGGDLIVNLAPLCHRHHMIFEDHAPGWELVAGHLRAYVMARASRFSYVIEKIGQARFDQRYPCPPFLAIGDLDSYRTPDPWLREETP